MSKKLPTPYKIIVVLGPTASGKSELAVKIARKFNGEIISADSRQVYKGLDIGSGKVPRDLILGKSDFPNIKRHQYMEVELPYIYKNIIHHLFDVASPKRTFTVARYQKLAQKALKDILRRGKIPIICGGTGFYIDALIYDYKLPQVPPRPKLRKQLEKKPIKELFKQLKKLDPKRAKTIDRYNKRRLVRALEIIIATGKPIPPLNKFDKPNYYPILQSQNRIVECEILKIGIKKSPEELKKLIKKRLLIRLRHGLIKEIKNLRRQGLSWQRLDNFGLEYRYVSRYLRNLINKKEMIDSILKESQYYAKRQMTWFKRDKRIHWIKNYKEAEKLVKEFLTKSSTISPNYPTSKVE